MILMDRGAIWDGGEVWEGIRPHPPAPSPQKDEERGRKKREFLKKRSGFIKRPYPL
jgi:hypothetical protein